MANGRGGLLAHPIPTTLILFKSAPFTEFPGLFSAVERPIYWRPDCNGRLAKTDHPHIRYCGTITNTCVEGEVLRSRVAAPYRS
ncbi:hypothetical protein J6590_002071 [Homalodisca vitripennis]|nr:hypothetical protein J6590_002071 [Homalodisca vitripennis]